jgi:hypothetical protein
LLALTDDASTGEHDVPASRRRGNTLLTATNLAAAAAVAFTLVVNLARRYPLIANRAVAAIAQLLAHQRGPPRHRSPALENSSPIHT